MNKIVGLIVLILLLGNADAATLTVNAKGGANYTRIQDAINAANAGDTILVYSGTYYENVNLNKQLILQGINNDGGNPVVDAEWNGNVITLSANGVIINEINVQRSGGSNNAGIYVTSNDNIIKNSEVSGNFHGIYISSSSNNTVSNNDVHSNNERGIQLYYSNNNNINSNDVSNNYNGIELVGSSNNIISYNTANSNKNKGIALYDYSLNNKLFGNHVTNNAYGIELEYSSENTIYDNYFKNGQDKIPIRASANKWNITKTLGTNIIGGFHLGGNFWANPSNSGFSQTCTDAEGDGICDLSYKIDESNIDYLPLGYKYATTPSPTPIPTTPFQTPTSTPTVAATTAAPTPAATDWSTKFRVSPSVKLRPVTDVIETNQDGIVELFMNNPSLNDVKLNVDARISVPAGIHVYGESFGQAADAGVVYGTFSLPPGTERTIVVVVKADTSARLGSHTIQFTGLFYPGDNKDAYQPLSLTYSVNVKEPSKNPESAEISKRTSTPTPIPTITQITTPTPSKESQLEQEVKELKERLNKTEEKQTQQESRISWLESAINSILDWLKSII